MKQRLTIGFSPCPNDTFIFYALMHGRVRNDDFHFDQIFEDVETLNMMAMDARLDITKVSYHALGYIRQEYCLLRSGGALGRGCGPIVVTAGDVSPHDLGRLKIAVPGRYTTAFLLLRLFEPSAADNVIFMPFDRIMRSVLDREADAGLVIHEGRFTYQGLGLRPVVDLGEWWESETGLPIPLGAIAVRRSLGMEKAGRISDMIRASIAYAREHRAETLPYIQAHAQELAPDTVNSHIDLYVNEFSLDVGEEGEKAVETLFRMAGERGIFTTGGSPLFCC